MTAAARSALGGRTLGLECEQHDDDGDAGAVELVDESVEQGDLTALQVERRRRAAFSRQGDRVTEDDDGEVGGACCGHRLGELGRVDGRGC